MTKKVVKKTVEKVEKSYSDMTDRERKEHKEMVTKEMQRIAKELDVVITEESEGQMVKELQTLNKALKTLDTAKSFALIAFGMTLGALIWMWL